MAEYYISSAKYTIQERATKKHGTVYDVVFRIVDQSGAEKQKRLSGYRTKREAKEAHAEFVAEHCEIRKGAAKKPAIEEQRREDRNHTVSDIIPLYMDAIRSQNKPATIIDKEYIYRLYVIPQIGSTRMADITVMVLSRWQDDICNTRTDDGGYISYKYYSKIRSHLGALLSWASSRYGYPNPLPEVKKPRKRGQKTEMSFWDEEQFDRFIGKIDDPVYHAIFVTLFYTGRRKGEVLALSPEDIHPDGTITWNKSVTRKTVDGSAWAITSTKEDKKQTLPAPQIVLDELRGLPAHGRFLFGGEEPVAENTLTRVFKRGIDVAGNTEIRIHDLRHSYVSMLIHMGANLVLVAEMIGDSVEQITRTYGHLYADDRDALVRKIGTKSY